MMFKNLSCVNETLRIIGFLSAFLVTLNAYSQTNAVKFRKQFGGASPGSSMYLSYGESALWVLGEHGVFGISGNNVKHFDAYNSGLKKGLYMAAQEDGKGNLWVAGIGSGVSRISLNNGETFNFFDEYDFEHNECPDIHRVDNGKMIASCGPDLVSFNTVTSIHSFPLKGLVETTVPIRAIDYDNSGNIWLVRSNFSLEKVNIETGEYQKIPIEEPSVKNSRAFSLLVDKNNDVWIGLAGRVLHYSVSTKIASIMPVELSTSSVSALYQSKNGKIWADGGVLSVYSEQKSTFVPYGALGLDKQLSRKVGLDISSISETPNGELLFTKQSQGLASVSRFSDAINYLEFEGEKFTSPEKTILLNEDTFLFISDNGSLYTYNFVQNSVNLIRESIGYVRQMTYLDENTVLIPTYSNDLYTFNTKDYTLSKPVNFNRDFGIPSEKGFLNSVLVFGDDIYLGFIGDKEPGMYVWDGEKNLREIPGRFLIESLTSQDEEVLISTYNDGVYSYMPGAMPVKVQIDNKLDIMHFASKTIGDETWFINPQLGLGFYNSDNKSIEFIDVLQKKGITRVVDFVEDEVGNLWLMTSKGLARLNKERDEVFQFYPSDGILDSLFPAFSSVNLTEGKVYIIGFETGYILDTRVANQLINERVSKSTNVHISGVVAHEKDGLFSKSYSELPTTYFPVNSEEIETPLSENQIVIGFSSNDYHERDLIGYKYRMLGLDNVWKTLPSSESEAKFRSLPAGKYTFEIKVNDERSKQTQPVKRIKISVIPPFWQTELAYMGYLFALVILVFTLHQRKVKRLNQRNLALEEAVNSRTFQLQKKTDELNLSNEKIEALLNKKRNLFENVSHEFRTPIALIIAPLIGLISRADENEDKKDLNLVLRNAEKLSFLVEQVLELARLDYQKVIAKKMYPINRSLTIIASAFDSMALEKNQQFRIDINAKGTVELMENSLELISSNLLSNAFKYTQYGGTVSFVAEVKANELIMRVKDDGPGIPPHEQKQIFDRFHRLGGSEKVRGSGIGLALVKESIQINNGTIELKSAPDRGCEFIVKFSVHNLNEESGIGALADVSDFIYRERAEDKKQTTSFPLELNEESHEKCILIVEDNEDMRGFLNSLFSQHYRCVVAENGEEGAALAKQLVPDIILSDLMMPKRDGFELISILREETVTSHIPFVLLTAKGDQDTRLVGWRHNIDDYVAKPFLPEELLARVERLLTIRQILSKKQSLKLDNVPLSDDKTLPIENTRDRQFFEKFNAVIRDNYSDDTFNRARLADKLALSERQLNRKLTAAFGTSFVDYLRRFRLLEAKKRIQHGDQITQVFYEVGFSSHSYFTRCFKAEFGITPSEMSQTQSR